jgi:hypothetical protein
MQKISSLDDLRLWKQVLVPKGTDLQRAMVRAWVGASEDITSRIVETFPTYTVHDARHARNVAELMTDLIGDQLEQVTALEAAFLLLAAHFHDIGMVFVADERDMLTNEEGWEEFLRTQPGAYVAMRGATETQPPLDIAEWFCRWRHAERVRVWVRRLAQQGKLPSLKWNDQDIGLRLEELCLSHNLALHDLTVERLPNDFRAGEADLFFCAILLRLADILDFDRSRSPDAVYRYLGLAGATTRRDSVSKTEWAKHLASEGMRFPENRSDRYEIDFLAAPTHPAVEYDVREFLDVIEQEFETCRARLGNVSQRWRDLPLPGAIDRQHIASQGYEYGALRFTLDQENIVDLLMGENLYSDPFVFIRELLQNAIDASRAREKFARATEPGFRSRAIEIEQWRDKDGYQWIRFDDFGIGMDAEIVRNYLLKVGRSYYRSPQFEAALLRSRAAGPGFSPISRFGIGLLSCFISGDQVEVSTRRWQAYGKEERLRFGLHGLHGFMVMQRPDLPPAPMPGPHQAESGYRPAAGTSIAVRIDPRRHRLPPDLSSRLNDLLLCSPVGVRLDSKDIGITAIAEGIGPGRHTVTLDAQDVSAIESVLFFSVAGQVRAQLDIVDLAPLFADKGILGRLVFANVELDSALRGRLAQYANLFRLDAGIRFNDAEGTLAVGLHLTFNKDILDTVGLMGEAELAEMPSELRDCPHSQESIKRADQHVRIIRR